MTWEYLWVCQNLFATGMLGAVFQYFPYRLELSFFRWNMEWSDAKPDLGEIKLMYDQ